MIKGQENLVVGAFIAGCLIAIWAVLSLVAYAMGFRSTPSSYNTTVNTRSAFCEAHDDDEFTSFNDSTVRRYMQECGK